MCETPPFHGTKCQGNIFQAPVNSSDHVVSCSVSFLCNRDRTSEPSDKQWDVTNTDATCPRDR